MDEWDAFRDALAHDIARLSEGEFIGVVVPEPASAKPVRRRWWRREQPPGTFVQFFQNTPVLMGECCAPRSRGGSADLSEEQQAQLRSLGWREPSEVPEYRSAQEPNYWHDWETEPERHVAAAALAVATLRGPLGVRSPDELTLQRS